MKLLHPSYCFLKSGGEGETREKGEEPNGSGALVKENE